MKEVKNPKKPLIFYYGVILLVVILLNLIAGPMLMQHQVKDVDYGTFLSMIADKHIGEVCTIPAQNLSRKSSRPLPRFSASC